MIWKEFWDGWSSSWRVAGFVAVALLPEWCCSQFPGSVRQPSGCWLPPNASGRHRRENESTSRRRTLLSICVSSFVVTRIISVVITGFWLGLVSVFLTARFLVLGLVISACSGFRIKLCASLTTRILGLIGW